ncbi:MAG: FmdB family transcriptional regulator [Anaerolineae bacterium]|nr:FmdB family transcriptional regulator [Anaerolineae bacterium]MCB0230805.1 FmdB family transcriptional regulator [Anaerolineae bacterium]MCB0248835.1 FmdB family transcriptional regulator [Anaerolineae bacterium]MCB9130350.1 FmdB family transcriptional regulator [Anaerolineales bacterium]
MPVYEYQCESCFNRFEKRQRFSDEPVTECPVCGGLVHKVIQPVGVIFKGSGFYVTDNRGKSSTTPPSRKDGDSGDSSGGDNTASGESKPETTKSETATAPVKTGESKNASS